jgi:hypothetical protein
VQLLRSGCNVARHLVLPAKLILISALACLGLLVVAHSAAAQANASRCANASLTVPQYKIAREFRPDVKPGLFLYVSVDPKDVTEEKLVTLVCALGVLHSRQETLIVWLFDDVHAAKNYNPQGEGNDRRTIRDYRGSYGYSRDPDRLFPQNLDWYPEPLGSLVHLGLGPAPAYRVTNPDVSELDRAVGYALLLQIFDARLASRKDVCVGFGVEAGLNAKLILEDIRQDAPKVHDLRWCDAGPRGFVVASIGTVKELSPGVYSITTQVGDDRGVGEGEAHFGTLVSRGIYTVKCEKGTAPALVSYQKLDRGSEQ